MGGTIGAAMRAAVGATVGALVGRGVGAAVISVARSSATGAPLPLAQVQYPAVKVLIPQLCGSLHVLAQCAVHASSTLPMKTCSSTCAAVSSDPSPQRNAALSINLEALHMQRHFETIPAAVSPLCMAHRKWRSSSLEW